MTVCRYFLQGNCRFGDRCRFEHTDPYESNTYDYSSEHDYSSYQNRGRQQPAYSNYNQGHDRQYDGDRYSQNNYSSQRNYKDERYGSNESYRDSSNGDYHANKYNKNKLTWMSEDYKKELDHRSPRSDNRFVDTSTPKSKTSFSFKDTAVHSRRDQPNDLRMNENNFVDAEIIKEDAILWENGNQWPFTCYCPNPGKPAFPGFVDLSPEELRLAAYNAKENNSYHSYVESVENAIHEIKVKREQLKEPSVQLMSIIEKIRRGEDLSHDSIDGIVPLLSNFKQTSVEGMVAEEFPAPQSIPASSFSFKTSSATGFGSQTTAASSFSFKLPAESSSKPDGQGSGDDIYTPMDTISQEDLEQFSAATFTLGKIPTVPPPQEMC